MDYPRLNRCVSKALPVSIKGILRGYKATLRGVLKWYGLNIPRDFLRGFKRAV
jgi:hypothetical protein